jgi:3-ketoacyl-CoA synthase
MSSQPQPETTATTIGTTHNARHRTCSLKLCYHLAVSYALYLFLAPVAAALLLRLSRHCGPDDDLASCTRSALTANPALTTAVLALAAILATVLGTVYLMRRPAVYLLDFACYKPGPDHLSTKEILIRQAAASGDVTHDNLVFQQKVLDRSGLGPATYLPKALLNLPPNPCMAEARAEAEAIVFGAVDQVLAQTGVRARDIGIVVVNCGLFSPMPSLSAMIVNHYKLRGNVASYSLGGMGCSAGIISIDLAKRLLQVTDFCLGRSMILDPCSLHMHHAVQ